MPTPHRPATAALIGISGFSVMLAMLGPQGGQDWPFLLAAGLGAAGAGALCADLFGQPGPRGLALLAFGAGLATLGGAAVAGLGLGLILALTPAGLIIGPMAVGQALLTQPAVLLTWTLTMGLAQGVLLLLRPAPLLPS